jgi:Tol biopolymer transport system component
VSVRPWPLLALFGALVLAVLLLVVPTASAATRDGYRSSCGLELSRGLPLTPGGPVCGTDEGDDIGFAGEDAGRAFFGENGHDTVEGSRYGDTLSGGAGNDELHGGRGDDRIDGGDDSDMMFGGLGDDVIVERRFGVRERLYGGPGDDALGGGRGSDRLHGGTGNDVLYGGSGSDVLYGGPGDDVLYGGPNRDVFDCGPGRDTVYRVRTSGTGRSSTERRDAFISRTARCERIVDRDPTADFPLRDILGTSRPDDLLGGPGRELLQGKGAGDRLFAGGGDDELEGDGADSQGDDLLMGGSGNDRLAGRAGNDRLYGDARSPVAGAPGTDELVGGAGRDLLVGGPGSDLLLGAYDGDRILAGAGNDVVSLLGGDTRDPDGRVVVDCGAGRDVVIINPDRRGEFSRCESFADQFHESDFGHLFRPSPEAVPAGVEPASVAMRRERTSSQAAPVGPAATAVTDPDGGASAPSLNGDGSRVAISSDAANLVANDDNAERTDPFVRGIDSGVTQLLDVRAGDAPAERGGRLRRGPHGALSADGRFAAFSSNSPDLGARGHHTIFRGDALRRRAQLACRPGNDDSENPSIGALGFHVVFESRATDLAGKDLNDHPDVYWCDVSTGALRRVSQPLRDGPNAAGSSLNPTVSADGRYVAFTSDAGGLVTGDGERAGVYWRDMTTGETRLVDVPSGALTSNGSGQNPKISADGRFVVFDSNATDLPGGELNGAVVDVFRKDMSDGSVALVSTAPGGAGDHSTADSLSADGSAVAFTSSAANLVPGDANGRSDVFVSTPATGAIARASVRADGGELAGPSSAGSLSGNGLFVAFASRSADAVPGAGRSERTRILRKNLAAGPLDPAIAGIDLPPRSLIAKPSGTLLRRRVRLVAGTARDNASVQRVEVAVVRRLGGRRCTHLGRGTRLRGDRCDKPVWLRARLTSGLRFTLRLGRLLPRGNYEIRSRAVDVGGQVEAERPGRNVASFALR